MKVDIEHSTKTTGLFKKETMYYVTIVVEFSEEEQAILRTIPIAGAVLYSNDSTTLRISDLMNGKPYVYPSFNPMGQQYWDAQLRENILPKAKALIDGNRPSTGTKSSFEL